MPVKDKLRNALVRLAQWLVRGAIALIMVVVSIYGIFAAANWQDDELRPEIKQAMAWQLPTHAYDDNGFILMLGMSASESSDLAAAGRQVLQTGLKRYAERDESMPIHSDAPFFLNAWKAQACNYHDQKSCVDFYLNNKNAVLDALSKNGFLKNGFAAILQAENFSEVLPPYRYALTASWQYLTAPSEMARAKAVYEIGDGNEQLGVQRLLENARFSRRLVRQTTTLIGRMIAIAMLQRDMRIISELVHRYPEFGRRHAKEFLEVATPISGVEFGMQSVMEFEKAFTLDVLKDIPQDKWHLALNESDAWINAPLSLLYLPNATANLWGARYDQLARLAEVPAYALNAAMIKVEQQKSALLGTGLGRIYLRNPIGKFLFSMGAEYDVYLERQHDTDGFIRLVALQLKLVAENVSGPEIAGVVQAAPDAFRDPYTGKPMEWDAAAKVLRFHGRQASNFNASRSNVFSVQVP